MPAPRLLRYALPLGFGLLLAVYWLDAGLGLFPYVPSEENRRPAALPVLDLRAPERFARDYTAYFDDRFRWRGRFRAFDARRRALTGGRSPLPDLVAIGKEDWYFKGGLQMDIYRGRRRFTPAELREVVAELTARRDSVAANGGRYLFAVAPLKHHLYARYLPDHVRQLNAEHAVRQLYRALETAGVEYVDLHAALQPYADTAAATDLYYRTDHHWTVRAGLLATEAIVGRLVHPPRTRPPGPPPHAGAFPPARDSGYYLTGETRAGMTLAAMAGRSTDDQETFYTLHRRGGWRCEEVPRPDLVPPADFPYPNEYVRQRQQIDPRLRQSRPSLFVTRESFGENLVLPLSEHFGRSFWLFDEWRHDLNLEEYRREGGDVYLQLVWEGFLFNLLRVPAEDGRW